ncbi:MAG TPA: glutamyl-tRNA reductase [Bacteroidia bacterium]|jgi:glutamyl-tRNA reductase|nr:glutamyl-tRNA reductase [Bacteroidia bacterium]
MENTFVIGITFKNADATTRSAFSISHEKQKECYDLARDYRFKDFVVLSTCNRTEIYGVGCAAHAEKIITTVCDQTGELLNAYKFVKTSTDALQHIFQVASGLDSQILGDFEILGQFKNACKYSKENGLLGPVFERMANVCIQASKEIKTRTALSKGTVSASYAAIEILKEELGDAPVKCLLVGTGKFGNNISKNIKHYLPKFELSISNRTYGTALEIATLHGFGLIPYEDVQKRAGEFDVIILSTAADGYIINPETLKHANTSLILDLSIPQTVHPSCKKRTDIRIFDIDSISAILDKSLENRKTYLPIANQIIHAHLMTFIDWSNFYKHRDQIVTLKEMLIEASTGCPHLATLNIKVREELVKKTIQNFVLGLKENAEVKFEPEKIVNKFMQYAQAG